MTPPPADRLPAAPADRPTPLIILVAYADSATRERAQRLSDLLAQAVADEFAARFSWWKFDFLRDARMFEAAVEEAVRADLLVFAVHAAQPLPRPARRWLDAWRHQRAQRRRALVALLAGPDPMAAPLAPVHSLLQQAARDAGMEFLPHSFPLLNETPCCLANTVSESVHRLTPLLEEILTRHSDLPQWGLNE